MDLETVCAARINGATSRGKALLETDAIVFRGPPRAVVPLAALSGAEINDGWLTLRTPDLTLELYLEAMGDRWLKRVINPPSLLDKLGVKAGQSVAVIGEFGADFLGLVAERVELDPLDCEHDIVFIATESTEDFGRFGLAHSRIKRAGAIWAIHPKGRRDIRDVDVMAAGRAAGLVDNKVCRFSTTHSALRFVIPRAAR
jgi:hypothetical protein